MSVVFNISVSLDMSVLLRIMGKTKPVSSQLIRKHAYDFVRIAKENAPVDTGALQRSIAIRNLSELSATISDNVPYGVFQEFGVGHPYLIDSPVYIRGAGWRYIKIHPGFPPQPFFGIATNYVSQNYFREFFPMLLGV